MEKTQHNVRRVSVGGALLGALFIVFPAVAQAATMYFAPSSGTYAVGTSFTTSIYVSSADQAMNAASSIVTFPTDKLEVESISKSGSIFSLWVLEPGFSNAAGTINLEGIVLNPGFTGKGGKILTIRFRAKAAGNAPVSFSSGLVLVNDGKGSNILAGLGGANFTINPVKPGEPEPVVTPPKEPSGTPAGPQIRSSTHPDPNTWYAQNVAKFAWDVPKDVIGARISIDKDPSSIPTETLTTPIDSKELTVLGDGVWYFSVRLRNDKGWGGISRFKFQIDTTGPSLLELSEERTDATDPRGRFIIRAEDGASGIDHFEVRIANESPQIWKDDESHRYETPVLAPGTYTLIVKAVDRAGNSLEKSAEFTIQPLEAPVITDYPTDLRSGEILAVKGTTAYPGAEVDIYLRYESDEPKRTSVRSGEDGRFTFVAEDRVTSGIYTLWAVVTDDRGAKSGPSEKVTIAVERPVFLRFGTWAIGFLSIFIPLLALILLLIYLAWHWWHKFAILRRKVKKEINEAEQALHKAFDALKEAIGEQIRMLDLVKSKRELTKEEERIIKQLKKDLDHAERYVRKEIEDVEKEVRES
ncbi:hypothetical protein KJ781_01645 [Patescibacteria group bacterium]|nr:hypothetical protein [Patescibacteria group bacterium]MBU1448985.1 hypothetical protein [Patescibacteria group bacterium]MBU2613458.1 hypothetical protein [Patescibacteria group bacterium]